MKTFKTASKPILGSVIFALAMATLMPLNTRAADDTKPMKPMKGGEHMMMLNQIETKEQADAVKPDETFAMVCGKCKTVYVTRVIQGTKGAQLLMGSAPTELIGTHACAGCGGTWTISGAGKGKTATLKHTCSKCGGGSGFCCSTKAGSEATKGMEKDKQ